MDVIAIKRIEQGLNRFGQRFLERFFTPFERDFAFLRKSPISTLAKRFAAKEACVKALGTGFSQGISWQDMEVVQHSHGQPGLCLYNNALKVLQQRIPASFQGQIHLSLSDDPTNAYAMVVISAEQDKE